MLCVPSTISSVDGVRLSELSRFWLSATYARSIWSRYAFWPVGRSLSWGITLVGQGIDAALLTWRKVCHTFMRLRTGVQGRVYVLLSGVGFAEGGHRVRRDGARLGEIKGGYLFPRQGALVERHLSPLGHLSPLSPLGHLSPLSPLGHLSPMSPLGHLSPLSPCSKKPTCVSLRPWG